MKQRLLIGLLAFITIGCLPYNPLAQDIEPPTAKVIAQSPADLESAALPTQAAVAPTATAKIEPTPTPNLAVIIPPTEVPPPATATSEPLPPTPEPTTTSTSDAQSLPGTILFDFIAGEPDWYTVDDDVMGGVSSSTVVLVDTDTLYFSGEMSLDNNGGFSSVRSNWSEIDLSGNAGLILRVQGDGLVYRLRIRTSTAGREISYNALFQTIDDQWQIIYIPFNEMVPTYRGFVMDVEELNPAAIGSFGFMLSDKQPGEFALQVDWIRAISQAEIEQISQASSQP